MRAKPPAHSPHERLFHLIVLVAVSYGVLILGVRFVPPAFRAQTSKRAVHVTVVSIAARIPPHRAIVLAQANARGAGRIPRALAAEEPLPSGGVPSRGQHRMNALQNRLPREGTGPRHGHARRGGKTAYVTTRHALERKTAPVRVRSGEGLRLTVAHLVVPDADALPPVRSLGRPERPAGAGRSRGWPSVSARAARYARYLALWKLRVERTGDELIAAKDGRNPRGQLRLEVKLASNGSVVGVALIQPSRRASLNTLALRILHRAEPFPPIPPGVLGKHRYLRFVYLWRFAGGHNRLGG